ncbi:MAG: DegV family protein [Acidimicrobiales bacterium]
MIGLVTDSASQIPPELEERLGVHVVPVVVTIDGTSYREGLDLTADDFWARIDGGELPAIATSQPSPGEIAAVYEALVADGATAIVSVHVGADVSGTVNAATVASELVEVPVHVVDSGTASFGVTACLWRAADSIAAGSTPAQAAHAAAAIAPAIGTSFILQGLEFARAGGRFDQTLPGDADDVVVLAGYGTALEIVGSARNADALCDLIVAPFTAEGRPVRVGVGLADDSTLELTEMIEHRLRAHELVTELVRYRVGPSIAAHTGPGTAGGFWWPANP